MYVCIYIYMCVWVCVCVRIIMYIWYPSIQWSIIFCYWLHALRHMTYAKLQKKKLCHHYIWPCFHKRLPALRRHADRSSTAVQLSYLPLPHGVRHGSNDLHTQCGPKNGPQIRRTSPQMNIHENYTTRIARLQKTDLNWLYNHHINFINCRKVSTQVGSSMMFPNHFQGVQLFYPKLGVANGLLWLLWLHIVAIGWCEPVEAHEC